MKMLDKCPTTEHQLQWIILEGGFELGESGVKPERLVDLDEK